MAMQEVGNVLKSLARHGSHGTGHGRMRLAKNGDMVKPQVHSQITSLK
jgi:hypothetical protein